MSTTTKTLLSLPTEILHRIFDDIDAKTIWLSVRRTCKQLQLAGNTYNRLKLDWVPKQKLVNVSQVLAPKNVLSLCVVCDKNSSTTNDSAFLINYLQQFTCLRFLTLYGLSAAELNILLNYLSTSEVTELIIYLKDEQKYSKTKSRLTTASSQPTASVKHCTLQRLSLNRCTYKQFSWIIHHCPNLQMLNLSCMAEKENNQTLQAFFIPMLYSNLTNLILDCSKMNTNDFEILLSCMPSILRLDLQGTMNSINRWFDGSYLKKLISHKLPRLKHLKYNFVTRPDNYDQLESIIALFRTPFWCEEKRWFFSCSWSARFPRTLLTLQSPPVRLTDLDEMGEDHYFTLFNIPVSVNGRVTIDTIRWVFISLDDMMRAASLTKTNYANYYYCSHPTHLSLYINNEWEENWLQSLLSLMELVHLESLSLQLYGDHKGASHSLLANIKMLLDRVSNIHDFGIKIMGLSMNKICSIVPRRIKSLTVWVKTYEDMETILEQLDHLSTVFFRCEDYKSRSKSFARITEWLIREKKTFTHKEAENTLEIYFQQNDIPQPT